MAIKVISTNGGTDFSSVIPAILINGDGDYVAISGVAGGTGDVNGPGSSTANALALFSGGSGKIIKNSNLTYASDTLSHATTLNISATDALALGSDGNITLTSANDRVELIALAGMVNINGSTDIDITADSGDVTIAAPAGNVIISGLSLLNQIQVGNGGGFVSTAAGQLIDISASSGVSIGGGSGPIAIGTVNSQVSLSTGDGAGGNGVFSAYPTSATMQVSEAGNEQYISILTPANNIWTKGNFRPETSGTNSIGLVSAPYSGVVALNVITQSPNGAFWRLAVSNAGVVSGVSYP